MVILNPRVSTLKVWIVFCFGNDFLIKSILTGCGGVTFPTVIWQYSVPLMAVISTADDSNRNSLMSSAALSTAKLLSEM